MTVGKGAHHLLHLAQLSCSIFYSVSLGLSFWPGKESVLLLEGKKLLPEPALFSCFAAPHTFFCNSCVLVKTKLSFLTLVLFSIPNLPPFLSLKPAQKARLPEVFPLIASANHQLLHVSFLQSNLFCNCDLITRVCVLLCICSMRQKPHLVWCCVPYGC